MFFSPFFPPPPFIFSLQMKNVRGLQRTQMCQRRNMVVLVVMADAFATLTFLHLWKTYASGLISLEFSTVSIVCCIVC